MPRYHSIEETAKDKPLSPQDQLTLILELKPLWEALGQVTGKLADKGITARMSFNAAEGVLRVWFTRESPGRKRKEND